MPLQIFCFARDSGGSNTDPVPASSRYGKLILVISLALAGFPSIVNGADNPATALEAPEVEVIGTTPLPGLGTPLNQVPANVQTATGRNIQKQQSLDLSDYANANLGSVNINDTLVNPFQLNVNFRGFTASPLLGTPQGISVFQDGVRVNEPFGDLVNWDLIPLSAISSINLIPGSNPLFGLNTLGGALAIHTKSGFEYPGFAIQSYGGSFGRGAAEFEVGGHGEHVDYFVTANVFREDGFREHSNSDVNQLFSKFGWQDEKTDLDLSLTAAKNKLFGTQPLPVSFLDNPAQAYSYPDYNDNRLVFLNLKGSHFFSDTVLIASNVYYRESKTLSFNSNVSDDFDNTLPVAPGNMPASNVFSDNDQIGYGGAVQLTLLGGLLNRKNQFTAGASIDHGSTEFTQMSQEADLTADRGTIGTSPFAVRTDVKGFNTYYGLYATDTFSLTEKLHFTASGRYNIAQVKLQDQLGTALNGNNQFTRFNPAAGLAYNPVKTLTLFGGYNEGTRAPTPVELTCANPGAPCQLPNAFLSDPPLKQVVSKTWEAGLRGQWQRVAWSAALFRTKSQDDIQFLSSGGFATSAGFFQNVGETRRQGIELGLHGKFDKFSFHANYALINATFESPFVSISPNNSSADGTGSIFVSPGNRITGFPRHNFKFRGEYEFNEAFSVGANLLVASSQFARGDENNQDINGQVPGYAVVNLDAGYKISKRWKLFAKVNNLFDRKYFTFGQLGANAFVGPGNTFDPTVSPANYPKELFLSPGAPLAIFIGLRYELGGPKQERLKGDLD